MGRWGQQRGAAPALPLDTATAVSDTLISSLDTAAVYRWIYYIEYIYSYVEKGKMKDRHLDRILFFIEAFNQYEERLMNGTGQSHTV